MKVSIDYLMDTGPLVAALIENEVHYTWSRDVLSVLGSPVLTTEIVVSEVCHLLRKRAGSPHWRHIMHLIREQIVRIEPMLPDEAERMETMMLKYPQMDLADASLVVLSERHPCARLITTDRRDFTVYRRRDGTPVPSIMPPAS
jgi:predicted nucleic acid-binding protein